MGLPRYRRHPAVAGWRRTAADIAWTLCRGAKWNSNRRFQDWYLALDEEDQARVGFHVDRLAEMGPLLDEPFTKQLDGKLRELRFYLGGRATRITYWIASNRRIILLTVFVKTRQRERREVDRARRAYQRCVDERHTAEEN